VKVYDLSREAVEKMTRVDLATLSAPPTSPIEEFTLNGATCGIGCFIGRPPWECHTQGDELLHVLAGETELTLVERDGPDTCTLGAGSVVVVPRGCWHRNTAHNGVTMLYITPIEGNLSSWADSPPDAPSG
jgi:mannose-6-phosphate isomerase-like protein (cupin superfamily)